MVALLKTVALLALAALLAAVALLVPAHLRSVDRSVVELAGDRRATAEDKVWEELNAANIGPARRIARATQLPASVRTSVEARMTDLLHRDPKLRISGGPDRTFEDFLELIQPSGAAARENPALVPLLLPRSVRASLSGALADSNNATVAALLNVRNLPGLLRLHPADHAAGAPYDAGVLTLTLLIEGGHFQPGLAQEIGALATHANANNPAAVRAVEDLVIATLSLGRRLEFRSLASLAKITRIPSDWAQMATLFRAQPERIAQLYTALLFSENPDALHTYLATHPETARADLDFALSHGPGAVTYLLARGQPVYQPATIAAAALKRLSHHRPQAFTAITLGQNDMGQLLKLGLLLLAGFAFALSMGAAWRGSHDSVAAVSKCNPMVMARNLLISLVFVLTVWIFFEPEILKSQSPETDFGPRIEFALADTLQSIKSPVKIMQELNQVTLLVLVLFFIIQLVIYSFCLIKMKEIDKQKLSADMKIKLLENEENLFDFGLYVGLGGTVLSLILVAVGIVEASLMAAYASTLFGILFTAMLKVLHLRPFRRRLIIQDGVGMKAGDPMKDIEL
jgi:hypothetical protein